MKRGLRGHRKKLEGKSYLSSLIRFLTAMAISLKVHSSKYGILGRFFSYSIVMAVLLCENCGEFKHLQQVFRFHSSSEISKTANSRASKCIQMTQQVRG